MSVSKNRNQPKMQIASENLKKNILAADAVGFSKLVSENEYETLASLKDCLNIFAELISKNGGRIFHSAGDSVLAEFVDSKNALKAARLIQSEICEHQKSTKLQKLEFRIGIDLGEVFADGENLLGEAVNFAVRLESFAQPNGISLSKRFYQNLGMSELLVSDHGIQTIKNSQIHCFDLILPGLRKRRLLSSKERFRIKVGVLFFILVLTTWAYNYFFVTEYERSSVAVVPFINKSDDPKLDYIVAGLRNEISGSLSQISSMDVISNSSINAESLQNQSFLEISKQLDLDHLVFGEISLQDSKIELAVNLYESQQDATSTIFSTTSELTEILQKNARAVSSVIDSIDVPISSSEKANALRQGTLNVAAYDEFLKGDYHFNLRTPIDTYRAKIHFDNAIDTDPKFARPYGYLGILFSRISNPIAGSAFKKEEQDSAIYLADLTTKVATSLGPNVPETFFARAFVQTLRLGQHKEALKNVNIALALRPSYADALGVKATALLGLKMPLEALQSLEKARKLNPNFSIEYLSIEVIAHLMMEEWSKAKEIATLALQRLPEHEPSLVMVIMADVALGNMEDALWNLEELLILNPDFKFQTWQFGDFKFLNEIALQTAIKIYE